MAIKIVYYEEPLDSYGRKEASQRGEIIFSVLNDSDSWSDDMVFFDEDNKMYFIDDLVGTDVFLDGIGIFTVAEEA